MNYAPVRKIIATAIGALVSAAGFLAWIEGTGPEKWREWLAIIVTAVAPPIVGYITPAGADTSAWWPVRKVAAALITGLVSSTVFLGYLAGSGTATTREIVAIGVTAILPALLGWLVPAAPEPGGTDVPAGGVLA